LAGASIVTYTGTETLTNKTLTAPVISSLSSASATALTLQSAGTTAVTVDTSQNVGIDQTSPTSKFVVGGGASAGSTNWGHFRGNCGASSPPSSDPYGVWFGSNYSNGNNEGNIAYNYALTTASWNGTTYTERMRIDSSGRFGFGTSSIVTGSTQGMFTSFKTSGSGTFNFGPNSTGSYVVFSGTTGVYLDAGSTSWSSTSDERVKENLIPIENGLTKVASLRAVTGNFIDDEAKKSRAFLIAQDVQAVLPEAISIQKDEQQTLGVQYTDVIPLLVASIKELKAINDTQAATITALTARVLALEAK
jgi:hypothetical protein